MLVRLFTVALLFAGTSVFLPTEAFGQNRNNQSGSNSLFGSSGSSSFSGGRSGAAGGGAGSRLGGGQLGGRGGAGGQGLGFGSQGALSANSQDGFVGRTENDVTNFFNQLNPLAQMGNLGGQNRGALNRGRDVNATQDVRPPVRVKVRVAFDPPPASVAIQSPVAQARLNRLLQTHGMPDARVSVQDGVAVLSGRVESSHEARLLARMVRLEPGVDEVVDRTESADALPAPPELP